jgi:L-alanine-DL-glutamate epimerase-like enolase superfamily enzyme
MAFGGDHLGRYVIVRVDTDEGVSGYGEAPVQQGRRAAQNVRRGPVSSRAPRAGLGV